MKKIVAISAFSALFVLILVYVLWPEKDEIVIAEPEAPTPEAWEEAGVPDFMAITDVAQKKKKFFNYLLPIVEAENAKIIEKRNRLLRLAQNETPSEKESRWLKTIGRQYREGGELSGQWFEKVLDKVDILPPSLALAQAANESGWGTSRFARMGNNYFGQWCFTEGCGLVPNSRTEGSSHEVQRFNGVQESVEAYLLNLNSHPQYEALRELRANARGSHQVATGPYLAQGLWKYSERGFDYVDEITRMIHKNKLVNLDKNETMSLSP